jgi:hypothetical protein
VRQTDLVFLVVFELIALVVQQLKGELQKVIFSSSFIVLEFEFLFALLMFLDLVSFIFYFTK